MHSRISVNSICFPTAGFSELGEHWHALSAPWGSFVSLLFEEGTVDDARRALDTGGCRLETVVHPFMPGQPLEFDEAGWQPPRERLNRVLDSAAALGARSVYLTTGGHGSGTWEDSARAFAEALAPCVERARSHNITLMIENAPLVYAELHIAHSLRDTVTLAEMAGIGVCIDIFSCWSEAGLHDTIERAMPRCGLVQVSDYTPGDRALPSRAVPGDGMIPLARILERILAAGYQGNFDLELLGHHIDREGHRQAVRRSAERTSELLHALGA